MSALSTPVRGEPVEPHIGADLGTAEHTRLFLARPNADRSFTGFASDSLCRWILEALDTATAPVDQGVLYTRAYGERHVGARAFDAALATLIELELVIGHWDVADDAHAPLDESRFTLELSDAGCEVLAAIWRAEAWARNASIATNPDRMVYDLARAVVDEAKLAITSPAYAVRFEDRAAMRAYMSGGAR